MKYFQGAHHQTNQTGQPPTRASFTVAPKQDEKCCAAAREAGCRLIHVSWQQQRYDELRFPSAGLLQ